jgi:hypothetical protein
MYEVGPCNMKLVFTTCPKIVVLGSGKLLLASKNHSRMRASGDFFEEGTGVVRVFSAR